MDAREVCECTQAPPCRRACRTCRTRRRRTRGWARPAGSPRVEWPKPPRPSRARGLPRKQGESRRERAEKGGDGARAGSATSRRCAAPWSSTPRGCTAVFAEFAAASSAAGPPYECPPKKTSPDKRLAGSPSAQGCAAARSSDARRSSDSRRESSRGEKRSGVPSSSFVKLAVPSVCSTAATTMPCAANARMRCEAMSMLPPKPCEYTSSGSPRAISAGGASSSQPEGASARCAKRKESPSWRKPTKPAIPSDVSRPSVQYGAASPDTVGFEHG